MKTRIILVFILVISAGTALLAQSDTNDLVWEKTAADFNGDVYDMKFMPGGNTIVIAIGNRLAEIDAMTGEIIREFEGRMYWDISQIELSNSGNYIYTKSSNGTLAYWNYNE